MVWHPFLAEILSVYIRAVFQNVPMGGSTSVRWAHVYILAFGNSLKSHKCLVEFRSIFGLLPVCLMSGREVTIEKLTVMPKQDHLFIANERKKQMTMHCFSPLSPFLDRSKRKNKNKQITDYLQVVMNIIINVHRYFFAASQVAF